MPVYVADGGSTPLKGLEANFLAVHPKWIVLSQSQEVWGELVADYPVGWEANVEVDLIHNG